MLLRRTPGSSVRVKESLPWGSGRAHGALRGDLREPAPDRLGRCYEARAQPTLERVSEDDSRYRNHVAAVDQVERKLQRVAPNVDGKKESALRLDKAKPGVASDRNDRVALLAIPCAICPDRVAAKELKCDPLAERTRA